MIVDAVLIWKHKINSGSKAPFSDNLNKYSKFAYILWVIAFATGEYIAIISR
jgi:hypothetical protein